jgi:hypothetical protein
MFLRGLGILFVAFVLCGCVDPVKPIRAWNAPTAKAASIASVTIVNRSSNATEEGLAALKTQLEQATAVCARGSTRYEMQVQVDNFKLGNAGAAMLIGDKHEIAGEVKLVDPATNAVVAQYYVQENRGGGGLIGVAMLASGATGIARDYANTVCKRILYYGA